MFWVEVENPKIGKAAMDGTSKESIVTSDITWPNGIAIDYTSKLSSLYCFYELSFDRKIKVFKNIYNLVLLFKRFCKVLL